MIPQSYTSKKKSKMKYLCEASTAINDRLQERLIILFKVKLSEAKCICHLPHTSYLVNEVLCEKMCIITTINIIPFQHIEKIK